MEWNKVQFHREYSNNFHGKLWEYYGNILGGTIALSSKNLVLYSETYFYLRFKTIYAIIFQRKSFKAWKTMTNSSTNFILKFKFLRLSLLNLNLMTNFCKSKLHLRFKTARNAISLKTASKIIAQVQLTYHVKCLKHDQFT